MGLTADNEECRERPAFEGHCEILKKADEIILKGKEDDQGQG